MALSRRRNGKCEFSALLFSQRPFSCLRAAPISFSAAPYEGSRSVTNTSGRPFLRIAVVRNFNAAFLSRVFVTKLSRSSSCQRQRLDLIPSIRRFRISRANIGPKRCHQNRTASWLTLTPRSCRRFSTLRSERGNVRCLKKQSLRTKFRFSSRKRQLRAVLQIPNKIQRRSVPSPEQTYIRRAPSHLICEKYRSCYVIDFSLSVVRADVRPKAGLLTYLVIGFGS